MTTKPEQPGANRLSIEERFEQAVLELEPSLMCENSYAKDILRRYFGDLGGARHRLEIKRDENNGAKLDAVFLNGVPLHHFNRTQNAQAYLEKVRKALSPDYDFAGLREQQAAEGVGTPPKQEQNTAAGEPSDSSVTSPSLSNEHPQSEPLCQVGGCGKPRDHWNHLFSRNINAHEPQTRIGAKERREHKEALNPACNRFRMNGWTWWDDSQINIRTGPPDRRKAQPKHVCGLTGYGAPEDSCPACSTAQPGKKVGDPLPPPTIAKAAEPATAPEPKVTAEQAHRPLPPEDQPLVVHLLVTRGKDGGHWTAHALELDLVAVDESRFKALEKVALLAERQISFGTRHLIDEKNIWFPAPESYFSKLPCSSLLAEREATIAKLEDALGDIWGTMCPDCGPEDYHLFATMLHDMEQEIKGQRDVARRIIKHHEESELALLAEANRTVAERDRTIAELHRQLDIWESNEPCPECEEQHICGSQAKADETIAELRGVFCEAHSAAECKSCPCCAAVAERILNEATAERLRGLLRKADSLLAKVSVLPHSKDFDALKGLRQRIKF